MGRRWFLICLHSHLRSWILIFRESDLILSGLILVALTKAVVLNFRNPSTQCFNGTNPPRSVTHISRTFLVASKNRKAIPLSVRANGFPGAGPCKNSLHPTP
jgi:hypothetical protein